MANILKRVLSTVAKVAAAGSPAQRGVKGFLVGRGERYAGAALFGLGKGYYRERFAVGGQPLDLVIGLGATVAAGALEIWSHGKSNLGPHVLGLAGDPGMMSWIGTKFMAWGSRLADRHVYVSDPGVKIDPTKLPAGLRETIGGALPSGKGAVLTTDEIRSYVSPRV